MLSTATWCPTPSWRSRAIRTRSSAIPRRIASSRLARASWARCSGSARKAGVFLVGVAQNGTFGDGAVPGQGGKIELHYGARIQLGKGGPILVLRELPDVTHPPRPMQQYGSRTIIEHHPETAQDLQAEIEALKMANTELDRQNQQLRAEKESLHLQVQTLEKRLTAVPPPLPAPILASPSQTTPRTREETEATPQRFSKGLLQNQKLTRRHPPNCRSPLFDFIWVTPGGKIARTGKGQSSQETSARPQTLQSRLGTH